MRIQVLQHDLTHWASRQRPWQSTGPFPSVIYLLSLSAGLFFLHLFEEVLNMKTNGTKGLLAYWFSSKKQTNKQKKKTTNKKDNIKQKKKTKQKRFILNNFASFCSEMCRWERHTGKLLLERVVLTVRMLSNTTGRQNVRAPNLCRLIPPVSSVFLFSLPSHVASLCRHRST